MPRLVVVANRLPVSVSKTKAGLKIKQSPGGLATGLSRLPKKYEHFWIGWPGGNKERYSQADTNEIKQKLADINCSPVFISRKQLTSYYEGFANSTIWPLFHYFPTYTIHEERFWEYYVKVNEHFCNRVMEKVKPDDVIWVQDYHLMLLPKLLREKMPEATIGFFLHIPFPSFEIFRLLPWRQEILEGLLGSDLIGFHTYDYVRHFLSSVFRITGHEHHLGNITLKNRIVRTETFPMGIDYRAYADAPNQPDVIKEIEKMRKTIGDRKVIASVDRLDYTKGILQRLEAFDWFLTKYPKYKGKVTMILVAVPSRTNVADYQKLRNDLEKLVGRVNGENSRIDYIPVWYLYRSLPFKGITALYSIADVALVTPLRDGMNLIAKEYVAAKEKHNGVLILGEMAGASAELGEALIVNSNNKQEIVSAIKKALDMPAEEQVQRLKPMQKRLSTYDIARWTKDFLETLTELKHKQKKMSMRKLTKQVAAHLCGEYKKAKKRLLLLDYDGTLVKFHDKPDQAGPDKKILDLLKKLSQNDSTKIVVVSGRDKTTLGKWLGDLDISLIAEHGGWMRWQNGRWHHAVEILSEDWKSQIRPILQVYADRTPGAIVEEKEFSLVWHCRKSEPALAEVRLHELMDTLVNLTHNMQVGVFEGSKILEVKQHNINKAHATDNTMRKFKPDFILAAGDDYTDEDMFRVLPKNAYSVKVGSGASEARYFAESVDEIRDLLFRLTKGKNA